MADLKGMIVDMVDSLLWPYEFDAPVDLDKWREEWRKEK